MQIRCPHCRNPINVVNDDPSGDVSCPSCGSCFNLAKDIETGHDDGTHGKRLGHFQLLNCLGQGAFGTVWKARDTELDRIVAIKIPRKENLTEADAEKFLREARAAAQVRHPNIVSVHEVGREDGSIYIASDFIDGASLDEWVQAHPLTVRESVELCATIAEALHHAHEAGVVHRDLKPQNILVTQARRASEGSNALATSDQPQSSDPSLARRASVPPPSPLTPFITDFGLAKRDAGEITVTVEGAILGTPAYMPPEQARGEAHHADRRSDVYSLGVILFRLLTGELPFRGQRQMLLVQILSEEPPALRKLDARLPRDVETICLKCLEKDPARRYQSAAALAADLRRWLTGHPIQARPVSRTERAWRWCLRNSQVASLTVAVILSLLIGGSVSIALLIKANRLTREKLEQTLLDQAQGLVKALVTGRPNAAKETIDEIQKHSVVRALPFLKAEFQRAPAESPAKLNAALGLARLGGEDDLANVRSLLRLTPDPTFRTEFLHRLAPSGLEPSVVFDWLREESDVSIRRALILALGEYWGQDSQTHFMAFDEAHPATAESVPAYSVKQKSPTAASDTLPHGGAEDHSLDEQSMISRSDRPPQESITFLVELFHHDPDSGIHGAAEWALRRWNQESELTKIVNELSNERSHNEQNWFVDRFGQTFALVRGPVTFWMGSSEKESEESEQPRHQVRLSYTFAISTHEITESDFERVRDGHSGSASSDSDPMPASWHGAAAYCNWISRVAGLPESEWCYQSLGNQKVLGNFGEELEQDIHQPVANFLQKRGYRLPTEAEWELACRSGTETHRYFGRDDKKWISRYSVQDSRPQCGHLKPNDWGLFDVYSSLSEWCGDWYGPYQREMLLDPSGPSSGTSRVIRGGDAFNTSANHRSPSRNAQPPAAKAGNFGFRLARTWSH